MKTPGGRIWSVQLNGKLAGSRVQRVLSAGTLYLEMSVTWGLQCFESRVRARDAKSNPEADFNQAKTMSVCGLWLESHDTFTIVLQCFILWGNIRGKVPLRVPDG